MNKQVRGVGVGTVSLVMIFAVLCLTVFAMLTLTTSNGEKIMSEKTAEFIQGYYEADSQATKIRAQVISSSQRGGIPSEVEGIPITSENKDGRVLVSYVCPINDVQELYVQFAADNADNNVMAWQARSSVDWEADDSIDVWDGTGGIIIE